MSPLYLPICGILLPFNLHVPSLIFNINFSFVCSTAREAVKGSQYFPCQMCYSHDECLFTCHCMRVRRRYQGCPIPKCKKMNFFMFSNNKFLGKCWYGGHPWIRLAMESESMVEKGINFIFCLGTAYDISSMESVRNSKPFSLVGWIHLPNVFISIFSL